MSRPWIIAHRGARFEAPENTRAAFDLALTYPIHGLELDVQLTLDGKPVVYHDRTLSKLSDKRKRISNYSLAELRKKTWRPTYAKCYKSEPLVSLDDVLSRYGHRTRLMIEIKSRPWDRETGQSYSLTTRVLELIRELIPEQNHENIFILSFDPGVLSFAKKSEPNWKYILNLSEPVHFPTKDKFSLENLNGLCVPIKGLVESLDDFVHANGRFLLTYVCNLPHQTGKALKMNADVIITDKPGWLTRFLKNQDQAR